MPFLEAVHGREREASFHACAPTQGTPATAEGLAFSTLRLVVWTRQARRRKYVVHSPNKLLVLPSRSLCRKSSSAGLGAIDLQAHAVCYCAAVKVTRSLLSRAIHGLATTSQQLSMGTHEKFMEKLCELLNNGVS